MTNGIDHVQGGGSSEKPSTPPKPDAKPEVPAAPRPTHGSGKQRKE
jgi:hypothetical protein